MYLNQTHPNERTALRSVLFLKTTRREHLCQTRNRVIITKCHGLPGLLCLWKGIYFNKKKVYRTFGKKVYISSNGKRFSLSEIGTEFVALKHMDVNFDLPHRYLKLADHQPESQTRQQYKLSSGNMGIK